MIRSTLDVVDQINQYMCDMNIAKGRTYLSCNSLCKAEPDGENLLEVHTHKFLNSLRLYDFLNHSLTLIKGRCTCYAIAEDKPFS